MNDTRRITSLTVAVCLATIAFGAQMPPEDVIDVPAIGEGMCVHNLFQSNMVIQRDKPIAVWGWATPGEKITVSFSGKEENTTAAADRTWRVTLPALPANSTPAVMVIKSEPRWIVLENVLVGDVWVLGGQSNMEFPLSRIENGALEIESARFENMRILTVPKRTGPEYLKSFPRLHEWSNWSKRHFRKGDWDVLTPEIARELSAIGYVFARRIHMATNIPIGVIDASVGGTTVETWTPLEALKGLDAPEVKAKLAEWDTKIAEFDPQKDLESRIKHHHDWVAKMKKQGKKIPPTRKVPSDLRVGPAADNNRPGNLYAGMIAPLAGIAVKGAIWHQGYNNCFDGDRGATMYYHVFPKMIAGWREAFGDQNMAFGIITLCTQGARQTRENFCDHMRDAGPYVREAQYKTFLDLYKAGDKNIGFTSSYDLRRRWYHPQLKVPAGERMARWALATQYGVGGLKWKPPILQEMKVEKGRIVLRFDDTVAAVDDGGPMEGFAIAGEDRKFHPADSENLIIGKDDRGRPRRDSKAVVLTSPMVPDPIHFRYAWARSPLGNAIAGAHSDVPLGTQRSDTWTMRDTFEAVTGTKSESDGPPERSERGAWIQGLRHEDIRRRLAEAKALLEEHEKQ
jgi:sialate O-acetylesterase